MAPPDILFPSNLIPESVQVSLPEGHHLRPVARDDYGKGYFECLQALTWTGNVTEGQFQERFDWMRTKGEGWFYNVVLEHGNRIVGNGVLIVERKFIWGLGMVGHLEEISLLEEYQGKGLGKRIINCLDGIAETVGCCKTILNCSPENEGFYEKCGYEKGGTEMSHEFEGFQNEPPTEQSKQ